MNCRRVGQNCSIADSILSSPLNNCAEVILFGKGIGESILIKSKKGDYIVVDSFINGETGRPVVLDYLDKFGISYSQIKCVLISHWHNDHIMGMHEIIKSAGRGVAVVINPIINTKKYQDYISRLAVKNDSEASEFDKVLSYIKTNNIKIILPLVDRCVYFENRDDIKITALSPQDTMLGDYIEGLLNKLLERDYSNVAYDDNLLSIVLLLEIGDRSFLLSSDMENRVKGGWNEIIRNYKNTYNKSSYYKVPHHGSLNGENEEIWNKLLSSKPLSFATLFNRSNLPREEDIERIVSKSKELYLVGERSKRYKELERELKDLNLDEEANCYLLSNTVGVVRVMFDENGYESIEKIGAVTEYFE